MNLSQNVVINSQANNQNTAPSKQPSPFPPVDTKRLHTSAQRFQKLMKEADLLIDNIVNSDEFTFELMNAAQLSNTKKVEELILSTGITLKLKTSFTPTGILIDLDNTEGEVGGCCQLRMALRW